MVKKMDLRVLRTKKMIFQAFIKLMAEKDYDSITIQDIADEAMINRATFYAHFKDKPNLYEQVFDYAVESFTSILDAYSLLNGERVQVKKIEFLLTQIFARIKENRAVFITLTEGRSIEYLKNKLSELLELKYKSIFLKVRITENDIDVPIDFIIEYMTSIFIGTVHWWVKSDSDFPPEHMARLVIKLIGNGHLTVLGIEVDK